MRSRSILIIVVLGVGGMAAMGFATKVAFDSNRELRRIAEFKSALLEAFCSRGVDEVSFRRRGAGRTELKLIGEAPELELHPAGDEVVASFYLRWFPHETGRLVLVYARDGGWGCGGPREVRRSEVDLFRLRTRLEAERRRQELRLRLKTRFGAEVLRLERKGGDLEVVLRPPGRPQGREGALDLDAIAREIARTERLPRDGRMRVAVLDPGAPGHAGAEAPVAPPVPRREVIFDARGRPLSPQPPQGVEGPSREPRGGPLGPRAGDSPGDPRHGS